MAALKSGLVFTVLCGYVCASPSPFMSDEMAYMCNETMDLSFPRQLHWRLRDTPTPKQMCMVRVRVQPHQRIIISLQFASDSVMGLLCDNNIYMDDISVDCPHANLASKGRHLCDNITTLKDLASPTEELYIYFCSNNTDMNEGFKFLLIPFHTGNCSYWEHECSNGRCIRSGLGCMYNYNNCRYQDCGTHPTFGGGVMPPEAMGIMITLMFVGIGIVVCCCIGCVRKIRSIQCHKHTRQTTECSNVQTMECSNVQTTECSNVQTEASFVSVISAPAYTPPCLPPPYSVLPGKHTISGNSD